MLSKKFKLKSEYLPTKEQKDAIESLSHGVENGLANQVLLGVTGSGKTFTVANVIERLQKPALIISHNKTLAAQLYQEFKSFFPENAVSFFVSYYDFYQPEAYLPATDTYIEKDADINELIDKLRLAATSNLLTRKDTIIVASVSCIYNIGSPKNYASNVFYAEKGLKIDRKAIIRKLIELQYERNDFGFHRGTFRVRGSSIDIYPAYKDEGIRLIIGKDNVENIAVFDPLTGSILKSDNLSKASFNLYPAKHYITDPDKSIDAFGLIKKDLQSRVKQLNKEGKNLEAHRLTQRVTYDLEMLAELGYVKGIENYSRYFDGRNPGDPPNTLLDYYIDPYKKDWLLFVDESHITFPQIRGMYSGDLSRKQTLVDYGFRLPSAKDNRPLKFDEFLRRIPGFIACSATPSDWELSIAKESFDKVKTSLRKSIANDGLTQQLLRPTGIPDPEIDVRPVNTQVKDVIAEILKRKNLRERSLITTLTKKTAEDLSQFLLDKGLKVHYLHSDIKTLERTDILDNLRKGLYDAIIGVNLLREGLDLPEVSLVAILDADKEGFLRSQVSLIQTMGRAARHINGKVILYADTMTGSMERAINEVKRRREFQLKMNKKYNINPKSIVKPIRERLSEDEVDTLQTIVSDRSKVIGLISKDFVESLTPLDSKKIVIKLRREMKMAAQDLNFELAAEIRDRVRQLEK